MGVGKAQRIGLHNEPTPPVYVLGERIVPGEQDGQSLIAFHATGENLDRRRLLSRLPLLQEREPGLLILSSASHGNTNLEYRYSGLEG